MRPKGGAVVEVVEGLNHEILAEYRMKLRWDGGNRLGIQILQIQTVWNMHREAKGET